MISSIISRLVILVFGTLYPAYASYKAVRTKNLKEYVKWMMYWIVFALFTCTETFTDVFLSWFPFYYEVKIVLVLWLLSPATKGSSILYRKFVHPALCRREQEIDEYIAKAKDQGYHTVLNLGTKGVNYATTVIMQTAIKGGGGLVQQLRKSYSLSDLTECDPREERAADEADDVLAEPRLIRRAVKSSFAARRSASESNSRQPMYFPEVDVDVRSTRSSRSDEPDFSHIKSTEDISSGYSSADNSAGLTRAGSVGAAGRARARTPRAAAVTAIKRPPAAEDNEVLIEEIPDDDSNSYRDMPSLVNISSHLYLSHTNPPFIYQYVGDQVKIIKVLGQLPLDDQLSSKHNIYNEEDQTEFSSNKNLEKDHCSLNNSSGKSNSIDDTPSNIPPQLLMSTLDSDKEDKAESTEGCSSKDQIADGKNNYNNLESNHNVADANTEFTKVTAYNKNNSNPNINEKELTNEIENETENLADDFAEPLSDDYSSDDEASYGTPSDSPTTNRKQSKGKYGKDRAPLPPVVVKVKEENLQHTECTEGSDNNKTSKQESITVGLEPNNIKNENQSYYSPDDLGPVNYNKTRQKSKSPLRVPKQSPSGFGKLLQLPSKLAFWHKADEKPLPDDLSVCSGEKSRRTSTDDLNEGFQKTEISSEGTGDIVEVPIRENSRGETGFRIANESDNETTSTNIIDKSDVLQKLIVAKIESHPEYKFVPLNAKDEIETTSKSTDV